ncbi:LCP family protein [Priestia filamentosa]|uniref:LCP family protein n=1 Tax=Priestia filamentosa TaxID=1402861 RepID=UPI003979D25F
MFFERLIKTLSILIVIFLFGYGAYLSFSIFFWQDIYKELPVQERTIKIINSETGKEKEVVYRKQALRNNEPFTFLILGTDSENIEKGRSDSIMLAVVEPKKNTINLLSIPRDTWVLNKATGKNDKITHAFNHGVSNTVDTIENYLQIPINYYALINMNGFIKMINTIGGLDITVEKEMQFYDRITNKYVKLTPGKQHLNGNETINYARFRGDGEGDFGRNRRQRQVIVELIKQTTEFQNLKNINKLTGILEDSFRTNVKSSTIPLFLKQLKYDNSLVVNQIELKGVPAREGKMSVVKVNDSDRIKVTTELQKKLGLTAE